jgi:CMP-N-acetylneuraminic acid synthetase
MIALLFMKEISERLPNKNTMIFNGKPLFYWILSTLSVIPDISNIVIDTDSPTIKCMINKEFPKIIVLNRQEHLKGNHITANKLIESMLDRIGGDIFLQTHVTNPLLKPNTIMDAICVYKRNIDVFNSLFGVTVHKAPFYFKNGTPINHTPNIILQTQKIEPLYEDNSNLYIFSRNVFNVYGRIGNHPYMYPISKIEGIDIDTEDDWIAAELLHGKGE